MNKYFGVGINTYPGAPLAGCVSDEAQHERKLSEGRYQSRSERAGKRRLNARATKRELLDGLKWLCTATKEDSLIFPFSGHGTKQVIGGKTQTVACTIDFCFDEAHSLTAHEILEIIGNASGKLLILWDSCHSEWTQNDRDIQAFGWAGERLFQTPRTYPTGGQPDVIAEVAQSTSIAKDIETAVKSGAFPCCYIAGCGAGQTSADVQDSTGAYGAASHYFWQAMDATAVTKPMSDVVALANRLLRENQFEQVMQCQGSLAGMSVAELLGV